LLEDVCSCLTDAIKQDDEASIPSFIESTVGDDSIVSGENTRLLTESRRNTLNLPTSTSRPLLDSRDYSPSSDTGDTLTIRASASLSNTSSWRSSRDTLQRSESNGSLLPIEIPIQEDDMFEFSAEALDDLFNPKSLVTFHALGGLSRIAKGLLTDCDTGLGRDDTIIGESTSYGTISILPTSQYSRDEPFAYRKAIFGENRLPGKKPKTLLRLMLIALDDKVLLLLSITSIISLALGLYQTFGQPHEPNEPRVEWVDGVTIMTAVAIAVILGALNDYQKELQFAKLLKKVRNIASLYVLALS